MALNSELIVWLWIGLDHHSVSKSVVAFILEQCSASWASCHSKHLWLVSRNTNKPEHLFSYSWTDSGCSQTFLYLWPVYARLGNVEKSEIWIEMVQINKKILRNVLRHCGDCVVHGQKSYTAQDRKLKIFPGSVVSLLFNLTGKGHSLNICVRMFFLNPHCQL